MEFPLGPPAPEPPSDRGGGGAGGEGENVTRNGPFLERALQKSVIVENTHEALLRDLRLHRAGPWDCAVRLPDVRPTAMTLSLSREAEAALANYPQISDLLDRFVRDQAKLEEWRERRYGHRTQARELVRRGIEEGDRACAGETLSHREAVEGIMKLREATANRIRESSEQKG